MFGPSEQIDQKILILLYQQQQYENIIQSSKRVVKYALTLEPEPKSLCLQILFLSAVKIKDQEPLFELANLFVDNGVLEYGKELLSLLIRADHSQPRFWALLSNVFVLGGQSLQAAEAMAHCVSLNESRDTILQLTHLLGDIGHCDKALAWLEKIPNEERNLRWFWLQSTLSPVVFRSSLHTQLTWSRMTEGLDRLYEKVCSASVDECRSFLPSLSTLFSLQYLCHPDECKVQLQYGKILESLNQRVYPHLCTRVTHPRNPSKLRIGMVSGFVRQHTVSRLFAPLWRHLSASNHSLEVWSVGIEDETTPEISQYFDVFHSNQNIDFPVLAQEIRESPLDILIYPELGMSSLSVRLASLRLAPVQAVGWGHPVTTGMSTIDTFLSSKQMEPQNFKKWYSEEVELLSGLGLAIDPPISKDQLESLSPYPLPEASIRILVSQSIFKVLPQHDSWYINLMKELPDIQLIFIGGDGVNAGLEFRSRMRQSFEAAGVSSDGLFFAPRMSVEDFIRLNIACDIFLDGIGWSGGMTTFEGLQCGLIPVTVPGEQMRTRHTHAILTILDCPELSVSTQKEWLSILYRLCNEPELRAYYHNRIQDHLPLLWNQSSPLEDFDHWLSRQ